LVSSKLPNAASWEDERVTLLARLVTFVDIDEGDDASEASGLSFSARHDAVLTDGRRVLLLNNRGWSQSTGISSSGEPPMQENQSAPWEFVTREQVEDSARSVVGPDEPYGDYTRAEMAAGHWATLAATLGREGVEVDATEVSGLPHDVELSDRLIARLADRPTKGA
jgi:hypothetical protein